VTITLLNFAYELQVLDGEPNWKAYGVLMARISSSFCRA
jgi:hypothetical protein